ncbi:MAG TPA: sulfite exporter TauE/SafE family protein [Solirubrobacteraceae bacterium]|nr:sulfite exporter TauE/SafE family protein [Solirubrobacteraceae bacterium]
MPSRRTLTLAGVGTAAGLFSGLFGVGGGIIMVPMLVLALGYGAREATGTSLAAIVIIAGVAAAVQGVYGNVQVEEAVLVGIPAVGGVLVGTWLQQRVPTRAISLLFAALLVASAVELALP